MRETEEVSAPLTPASFLSIMEPLVRDGNPYAGAYTLRMIQADGDPQAAQAVVDDFTQAVTKVMEGVTRIAAAISAAFGGIDLTELVERLAPFLDDDEDDQADYDDAPDGCWATSVHDDEEACDLPAVDELGLCSDHRAAMA